MRKYHKIIFSLGIFVLATITRMSAHQPDISNLMIIENDQHEWTAQIQSALTAFEHEVNYNFGEGAYSTPEEFKDLVIKHVREHFSIKIKKTQLLELTEGQVQLGHETTISFRIPDLTNDLETIVISNKTFENISRNQALLIIAPKGIKPLQATLNYDNNHAATISKYNDDWSLNIKKIIPHQEKSNKLYLSYAIVSVSIFVSLIVFLKKFNKL